MSKKLCKSSLVEKEFYTEETWFTKSRPSDRTKGCINYTADVTELNLSGTLIGATRPKTITVETVAIDPENDVLTYSYTVSAGQIVGRGAKVVWDMTGVTAGTYTITAAVDDGCGLCGKTVTKTVTVE